MCKVDFFFASINSMNSGFLKSLGFPHWTDWSFRKRYATSNYRTFSEMTYERCVTETLKHMRTRHRNYEKKSIRNFGPFVMYFSEKSFSLVFKSRTGDKNY